MQNFSFSADNQRQLKENQDQPVNFYNLFLKIRIGEKSAEEKCWFTVPEDERKAVLGWAGGNITSNASILLGYFFALDLIWAQNCELQTNYDSPESHAQNKVHCFSMIKQTAASNTVTLRANAAAGFYRIQTWWRNWRWEVK